MPALDNPTESDLTKMLVRQFCVHTGTIGAPTDQFLAKLQALRP